MQQEWFKQSLLSVGFVFVASTSPQSFVLSAPDNNIVGNGTIEISNNNTVQAKILFAGDEYLGTGTLNNNVHAYVLEKSRQGLRSDRALMQALTGGAKKQANITLNALDGASLVCKFKPSQESISGQCINPSTQQTLSIRPNAEERT